MHHVRFGQQVFLPQVEIKDQHSKPSELKQTVHRGRASQEF